MVVNVRCIKELYLKAQLMEIHGLTQLGMTCSLFLDEQMEFQVPTADFFKNFSEDAGRKRPSFHSMCFKTSGNVAPPDDP